MQTCSRVSLLTQEMGENLNQTQYVLYELLKSLGEESPSSLGVTLSSEYSTHRPPLLFPELMVKSAFNVEMNPDVSDVFYLLIYDVRMQ